MDNDKLLNILYSRYTAYHDQKENVTYIGIGIELTLLTTIIALPQALSQMDMFFKILFFFLLAFLHYFIRSQLRMKRWAAIHSKIILSAMLKVGIEPEDKYKFNQCCLLRFLDYILPVHCVIVGTDVDMKNYPPSIIKYSQNKKIIKSKTLLHEWILTIFSIVILCGTAVCFLGRVSNAS